MIEGLWSGEHEAEVHTEGRAEYILKPERSILLHVLTLSIFVTPFSLTLLEK